MDNIYQKFDNKAAEQSISIEKYISQQINQNIIPKKDAIKLLQQIHVNQPNILINLLLNLHLDIFKQLFFRVNDSEILNYIFDHNNVLLLRLSKIRGPSEQLCKYLFDTQEEQNKMYFLEKCKYSKLIRTLSNNESYQLSLNLVQKDVTRPGFLCKYFNQLLISHQDMAYSENTVNQDLVYKSTFLLSKLVKSRSIPKKFSDYKNLTNSRNQNLHNLAFQSFRLSCIAPCRSIYHLRHSTLGLSNNFLSLTIRSMEELLLSGIFHGELITLAKKMMNIVLKSEKVEFDVIDDLLAFYREVFRKKKEIINDSGELLLSVIVLCLKNTENSDFWINCCFLAEIILDNQRTINTELLPLMLNRCIKLNTSVDIEEQVLHLIICVLSQLGKIPSTRELIINSSKFTKILLQGIAGANRVMNNKKEVVVLKQYTYFLYNTIFYTKLENISACFGHLAALLIALIVREGDVRTIAQSILENVTQSDEFCQKLIEQISNNLDIIEVHFTQEIKQRLEPFIKCSREPPEEFLDPITYNLMHNPVILPFDNLIVDESTLINLSNGKEENTKIHPYIQKPFDTAEVKPATEKKKEIKTWLSKSN